MAERSDSGKGNPVAIYVLGPANKFADPVVGAHGNTAMCAGVGEDYATTRWPVVVKAKSTVTRAQLIHILLDLASAIEQGRIFVEVDEPSEKQRMSHANAGVAFGDFRTVEHDRNAHGHDVPRSGQSGF